MRPKRNDNHRAQRRRDCGGREGAVSTHQQGHMQQGHHPSDTFSSARGNYVRYLALACQATVKGDTVEMENSTPSIISG